MMSATSNQQSAISNQRRSSRPLFVLLAAGGWLLAASYGLLTAQTAWACALCKELLGNIQSQLAKGYFWSIILLVSMPFLIIGGITWRIVRATQRRAAR